ncbi:MAG: asparagine synthase-related protein [Myxococcota bacterium]|nr:asparagine synthase-related protein [Myxococcota bacterium]
MTPDLYGARCEPRPLAWQGDACVTEPEAHELATLDGHFAFHVREGGGHVLARDPLGVHKRFVAIREDGSVDDDRLLARLLRRHPAERVFSVPSSSVLRVSRGRVAIDERAASGGELHFRQHHEGTLDQAIASSVARIEGALARVFDRLEHALAGRSVWVTLSGGLDSSTVAALAAERFPSLRAITFRLDDGPLADDEDLAAARRVAAHLGIPLFEVVVPPERVLSLVDEALVHGQDWRDFNVHCALVNAALAQALGEESATEPLGAPPVVLTGDGANELFADYAAEQLEGRLYYELPRLPRGRLRRFLVRGLDAGDREAGPFAHHGAEVVQPYLLAASAYAALPDAFVEDRAAKQRLAERLVGTRLPRFVFERPKVRAQCAREGRPGGTLALLHAQGVDQAWLLARFSELLAVEPTWARELIRGGVYRTPRPTTSG